MKNIIVLAGFFMVVLFPFHNYAAASEVTVSGSSQFDCSLSSKFMEKHGYVFIEESYYGSFVTTNMYAAKDAEIIIEDEYNNVLGKGPVDEKGKFSITVPQRDLYRVIARFHGTEIVKQVQYPKIEDIVLYMGYVKSDIVDSWSQVASRTNCGNC